jgi:gliding motility-associated-like protein
VNDVTAPTGSNPVTVNVECIGDVPLPGVTVVTDEADNCTANPVVAHVGDVSDGLSCPETITRTYSITDDCGNVTTVDQLIIVNDITPPTASAPATVNVECIGDVPLPDVTIINDEADNCTVNPVVVHVGDVSDGLSCPETITRTYSITDDCGNQITVDQFIIVNDITPPTASNPAGVVVELITDVPAPDPTVVIDELDNCTVNPVVAWVNDVSDGLACPETITRTYSVTDDCGNQITVTQTIVVSDITLPTASNPVTVNVECIGDVPLPDVTVVTDEADNSGIPPVVAHVGDVSDGLSCPETITRTYSVTDDCGNQITVDQLIIVNDVTPPTASNPVTVNVECIGDVPATDITVVTDEADNCTANPVVAWVGDVSDGLSCPETITRTYSVTDDCGNQITVDQLIIVNDITPPTASVPPTVNVECIGDVPAADILIINDEADNCTVNPVVAWIGDVSDGLSCPETITRTYSITDDCGNQITVDQFIVVNDVTPPTASNPAPISVPGAMDVPAPDPTVVIDELDNCTANPVVAWVSDVSDGNICNLEVITRTYSVTDDCGNQITVTQEITILAVPAPIDAGNDTLICEGQSVTLTADNPWNVPITWTPGNPPVDGVPFVPTGTQTYTVEANNLGCLSSDQITVTVEEPPVVSFMADVTSGCEPLTVTFTNTSTTSSALADCIWDFGGAGSATGCGSVTNTFQYGGLYDVTLTTTSINGCTNTITYDDYIYVEEVPLAAFTPSQTDLTTIFTEVIFTNNSQNATDYIWTFGDGSPTSSVVNPTHVYPDDDGGAYTVQLIALSPLGCSDTAYAVINISEETIFYVPNTFTPDGDDYNEFFQPVFTQGYDPFDFDLFIFNRWGEIIWESHDASVGWDGTYGGNVVQDGTYTWKIEFKTTQTDERIMVTGHVNVIR